MGRTGVLRQHVQRNARTRQSGAVRRAIHRRLCLGADLLAVARRTDFAATFGCATESPTTSNRTPRSISIRPRRAPRGIVPQRLPHGNHRQMAPLSGYRANGAPVERHPDEYGFEEVILSAEESIGNGSYFYPWHHLKSVTEAEEHEFIVECMNREALGFHRAEQRPALFPLSEPLRRAHDGARPARTGGLFPQQARMQPQRALQEQPRKTIPTRNGRRIIWPNRTIRISPPSSK